MTLTAEQHRARTKARVTDLLNEMDDRHGGPRSADGFRRAERYLRPDIHGPCPQCGTDSTYVRSLDRFVHADGTDSRQCWIDRPRGLLYEPGDGFEAVNW